MQDLINRLQGAKEGSPQFDMEIAMYAGWEQKGENSDWFSLDGKEQRSAPPCYTQSVDAALKLVPEGSLWDLNITLGPFAQISHKRPDGVTVVRQAKAATPALALCIAALEAHHSIDIAFESSTM